jgi:mannose-6-phosphate isomerase-like protein (cupin superfamily)
MERLCAALTCVAMLTANGLVGAQAPALADPLAGWASRVDLESLVKKLRSGELKGPQTLFERPDGPYRVYTSFIDGRKGAADIHEADDELFLVLSGSARSTLGGEIADRKATAPHEFRGTVIRGGTTRTVGAGDVISAPRGTPHQMDATGGHILYVVIKVMGGGGAGGPGSKELEAHR